jgi:heterodisulfide reductase subunit B
VTYAYYPGCSLEASSVAYGASIRQVADALGLELREITDWNCCGATEYFTLNRLVAYSVIARNLALVGEDVREIVAPCSACYHNLKKTDKIMSDHPRMCQRINEALAAGSLQYAPGRLRVRHLLDVLYTDVGEAAIRERVTNPLVNLRVAPYYGCQILRPLNGFDDPEYPRKLDELLGWLGAEVVDYPVKGHCCGGHMTQISEDQALELIRRLLQAAADYDADVVACLCPMCQLNLDAYQGWVNSRFSRQFQMPVLFFTQLVGLAFGIAAEDLGFGREMVSAEAVLGEKLGAEVPAAYAEAAAKPEKKRKVTGRKRDSKELPMPRMD